MNMKLLNKNTIILNERYNLWNLKRVPVRMKLPVMLEVVDEAYIYNYYKDKQIIAIFLASLLI